MAAPGELPCPLARAQGRKLLILATGSRGDVQPVAALGLALQRAGFVVCMGTNSNHVEFFKGLGLDAVNTMYDFQRAMTENAGFLESMKKGDYAKFSEGLLAINMKNFPGDLKCMTELLDAFKPDVLLGSSLELFNGSVLASSRGIPFIQVWLSDYYPSKYTHSALGEPACFPHRILGTFMGSLFWKSEHAAKAQALDEQVPGAGPFILTSFQQWMYLCFHPVSPAIMGFSPQLVSVKADWSGDLKDRSKICGFWVLSKNQQESRLQSGDPMFGGDAKDELAAFLEMGQPPVYMGWGSMLSVSSEHMTQLAVRALMRTGQRGVVLGGWADLNASRLAGMPDSDALAAYAKEHVLFVRAVPHEWLFPRCAAIVHHGGSGTTAAALRSGVPSVITPIWIDQFSNANIVSRSGAGVKTQQLSKLTVRELANAVQRCMNDEKMIKKARALGEQLQAEDGLRNAVTTIDDFILKEVDTGVWRANFEDHARTLRRMKAQSPPSCLAWIGRLCCSLSPNEYKLAKDKQ